MSIAIAASERLSLPRRFVELLPGVALLFTIGYAGKLIEQSIDVTGKAHKLALPKIEYVLWAILIGLVIANTTGVSRIFRAGQIPWWNFYDDGGQPLAGNPNSLTFYPDNFLYLLLPAHVAFNLHFLLHLAVAWLATWT